MPDGKLLRLGQTIVQAEALGAIFARVMSKWSSVQGGRRFREEFSQHSAQHITVATEVGAPNFVVKSRQRAHREAGQSIARAASRRP